MPAGLTSVSIVNQALEQIAAQFQITSLTDGSDAANAAQIVYAPTVQLMLRLMDPAFAFTSVALTSAAGAPLPPWAFMYLYPSDMVRLRQVRPPLSGLGAPIDPNDPQPVRAQVASTQVSGSETKVILTNQTNAIANYTTSTVIEAQWDSAFTDAVVRRLANPLAMAIAGRPDFARELLAEAGQSGAMANNADEGGFRRVGG